MYKIIYNCFLILLFKCTFSLYYKSLSSINLQKLQTFCFSDEELPVLVPNSSTSWTDYVHNSYSPKQTEENHFKPSQTNFCMRKLKSHFEERQLRKWIFSKTDAEGKSQTIGKKSSELLIPSTALPRQTIDHPHPLY